MKLKNWMIVPKIKHLASFPGLPHFWVFWFAFSILATQKQILGEQEMGEAWEQD